MDVILDRPSVHPGDDTSTHEVRLTVPDDATVAGVLEAADLDGFLPWFSVADAPGRSRHGRWTVTTYDAGSWRPGGPLADATGRQVARYDDAGQPALTYDPGMRDALLRSLVAGGTPVLYFG